MHTCMQADQLPVKYFHFTPNPSLLSYFYTRFHKGALVAAKLGEVIQGFKNTSNVLLDVLIVFKCRTKGDLMSPNVS